MLVCTFYRQEKGVVAGKLNGTFRCGKSVFKANDTTPTYLKEADLLLGLVKVTPGTAATYYRSDELGVTWTASEYGSEMLTRFPAKYNPAIDDFAQTAEAAEFAAKFEKVITTSNIEEQVAFEILNDPIIEEEFLIPVRIHGSIESANYRYHHENHIAAILRGELTKAGFTEIVYSPYGSAPSNSNQFMIDSSSMKYSKIYGPGVKYNILSSEIPALSELLTSNTIVTTLPFSVMKEKKDRIEKEARAAIKLWLRRNDPVDVLNQKTIGDLCSAITSIEAVIKSVETKTKTRAEYANAVRKVKELYQMLAAAAAAKDE